MANKGHFEDNFDLAAMKKKSRTGCYKKIMNV